MPPEEVCSSFSPTPLRLPAIHPRPAAATGRHQGLPGYAAGSPDIRTTTKPLRRFRSLSVNHDSHAVRISFAAFDMGIPCVVVDE